MTSKPRGFSLSSSQICIPSNKKNSIDQCVSSIPLISDNANYHKIASATGLDLLENIKNSQVQKSNNNAIFIIILGSFFCITLLAIFVVMAWF